MASFSVSLVRVHHSKQTDISKIGTALVCSFLEMFLAFVPSRTLKRLFPPMITGKVTYFSPSAPSCLSYIHVTGTVVLLIGSSLVGASGALNWGGGANGCQKFPTSGIFQQCPTTLAPRPLPWGSPEFIGIGFLSFISIILTEMFGSPFLKNISIIMGLAVGCIVAGATGFIDGSSIKTAPAITFLWYVVPFRVCLFEVNLEDVKGAHF